MLFSRAMTEGNVRSVCRVSTLRLSWLDFGVCKHKTGKEVHLDLRKNALWTGQVVSFATIAGRPGNPSRSPQIQATAGCALCSRCNIHNTSPVALDGGYPRTRPDISGHTFSLDRTRWLGGSGHQKGDARLPNFRLHKESMEVLLADNCCTPAWVVEPELASSRNFRMDNGASAAFLPLSLPSHHDDRFIDPGFQKSPAIESVKNLCQQGQVKRAVEVLEGLVGMNSPIDKYLFYSALKECISSKDLMLGGQVHALALKTGLGSDTFLCNHLIQMYASHGKLREAMDVFRGVALPDAGTWSSIIFAHVKRGQAERAIQLYQHMRASGLKPNGYVLVAALQACAAARDLQTGRQVHHDVLRNGMEHNRFVCSCLVDMFAKCGSLKDARMVFDGLDEKNVVTWNAMISGYARVDGMGQEALSLYGAMDNEGMVTPDEVSFIGLLQACANVGVQALDTGKRLHSQLKERRLESGMVIGGNLVNMYVKCGSLEDARTVFDGLTEKNVVTWTAMIAGYAQQAGMGEEVLGLYSAMRNEGVAIPDVVTFTCLLQACANTGAPALDRGKQLHSHLKDLKLDSDMVVGGSLVNMYVKCGSLEYARIVFDGLSAKNVVTWTAMVSGYAQQECMAQEAISLYSAMHSEGMVAPDAVTFVCLLQACANVGVSAFDTGKQIHSQLIDRRLESNVIVGGSLVNMYVKCGSLKDARIVFDGLVNKNVVTWNAMISGYAGQEGMGQEALNIYGAMRNASVATPDAVTYVCLLQACASVGALQQGKLLHSEIRDAGLESDLLVGNSLVNMYAKCGCLEVSREVLDRLPLKDLVTWNALLKGYAEHGESSMAIQCFDELVEQGIQPDGVTYACLFTACSHAGLVDLGQQYFETMVEQHGIEPNDQLFCCMVDLLGRSGHLDRAEKMLRASGLADNVVSWTALLSACKSHGDVETGNRCFDQLMELEPTAANAYVLLGGIYANIGRWDEVDRVESLRKIAGARKMPGKACIEVKDEVHEFTVGQARSDVAVTLRKMNRRVKEGGHVPQTQLVLRAASEQEKENALCGHAEKLALAYGLLNTPAGSTLLVTKNLRMCNDCHSSTKIMSRLEKREIVVRDGHKVHRFQNGACSCQDRH